MNIFAISDQPYPTGSAGSLRVKLFLEYLANGNTVRVFFRSPLEPNKNNKGNLNGVYYERIGCFSKNPFLLILGIPWLIFRSSVLLIRYKSGKDKNIIFCYNGLNIDNIWSVLIGKILGYKIVVDIVEDYSLSEEKVSKLRSFRLKLNVWLDRFQTKLPNGLVVISTYLEKKYKSRNSAFRTVLIPVSALNLNKETDPKKNTNREDSCFHFVYGGTYGIKDGTEFLIKAFDKVSRSGYNVKLILSGKINNRTTDLIQSIKNEHIEITGWLAECDYYDLISGAGTLCMTRINSPFANAGFPFKLGEYLATAKPVIVTSISDVKLYLVDKKDAVFAEPSNVESLVEAMTFILENRSESETIGINGRKKAMKHFNPEINGKMLEDFMLHL